MCLIIDAGSSEIAAKRPASNNVSSTRWSGHSFETFDGAGHDGDINEPRFISLGRTGLDVGTGDALTSLATVLHEVRGKYKCIIVDLPPLLAEPDSREITELVDGFVFVVRWGDTSRLAIAEALEKSPEVAEKIIATVLVDAPKTALKRAERYRGRALEKYFA
jgi:hypothetical protein